MASDETRTANTHGGDYAEGDIDKRIDAPVETNADVTSSAVVGANTGSVANATGGAGGGGGVSNVLIQVQRAAEQELPPELQNATLRQMQIALIAAVQDLEERWYYAERAERAERAARQAEVDAQQAAAEAQRLRVTRWLVSLTVAVTVLTVALAAVVAWAWQWMTYFGWLWQGR